MRIVTIDACIVADYDMISSFRAKPNGRTDEQSEKEIVYDLGGRSSHSIRR